MNIRQGIISLTSLIFILVLMYIIFHFTANASQKCLYINDCEAFFEEEIEQFITLDDETFSHFEKIGYTQEDYHDLAYTYISAFHKDLLYAKLRNRVMYDIIGPNYCITK